MVKNDNLTGFSVVQDALVISSFHLSDDGHRAPKLRRRRERVFVAEDGQGRLEKGQHPEEQVQ